MNFDKLLTEQDFAEIIEKVKNFDLFEIVRFDKTNRIELRICASHCDNRIWQNNFYCSISGSKKYGDFHGFGHPYQRNEFLKLTYDDIVKSFSCYGYKKAEIKQLDMFALLPIKERSII